MKANNEPNRSDPNKKAVPFTVSSIVLLALLLLLFGGATGAMLYFALYRHTPPSSPAMVPLFLLGYILICLTVVLLYIRNIFLPIRRIQEAMRRVYDGNFDSFLPENGLTEYADLSGEVNRFLVSIRQILDNEYYSKILKKRAELNALQSQINPHFLYNTIDCIRGQALCEGSHSIADMAKALSSIFRYSIDNPNAMVTLGEELSHVSNYFSIQQYRFSNRFTLKVDIEQDEHALRKCRLPKLTLQPLVENAIVHGYETKPGPGLIHIRVLATQSRLLLTVEDEGIGIPPERLERICKTLKDGEAMSLDRTETDSTGTRFALLNVNERIRICFGAEYGVRLYSTYGVGTQCEVVLPLITGES